MDGSAVIMIGTEVLVITEGDVVEIDNGVDAVDVVDIVVDVTSPPPASKKRIS